MEENWFTILAVDLVAGILAWGLLEAVTEINPKIGMLIAAMFTIIDYITWIVKGYNIASWIVEGISLFWR